MTDQSTALAVRDGGAMAATQMTYTMADLSMMAQAVAKSNLFGMKTSDQALALMLIAQAEGRHPATVAMDYDIIQGRPAIRSQAALARFQGAGGRIEWLTRTDEVCEARFSHKQGGELTVRWDMARAVKAGLWDKDNWKKSPAQMLAARVVSEGVRAVLPICLNSLYLPEEVEDFDAMRTGPPPPSRLKPFGGSAAAATVTDVTPVSGYPGGNAGHSGSGTKPLHKAMIGQVWDGPGDCPRCHVPVGEVHVQPRTLGPWEKRWYAETRGTDYEPDEANRAYLHSLLPEVEFVSRRDLTDGDFELAVTRMNGEAPHP